MDFFEVPTTSRVETIAGSLYLFFANLPTYLMNLFYLSFCLSISYLFIYLSYLSMYLSFFPSMYLSMSSSLPPFSHYSFTIHFAGCLYLSQVIKRDYEEALRFNHKFYVGVSCLHSQRHPELPDYHIKRAETRHCVACTKTLSYWLPIPGATPLKVPLQPASLHPHVKTVADLTPAAMPFQFFSQHFYPIFQLESPAASDPELHLALANRWAQISEEQKRPFHVLSDNDQLRFNAEQATLAALLAVRHPQAHMPHALFLSGLPGAAYAAGLAGMAGGAGLVRPQWPSASPNPAGAAAAGGSAVGASPARRPSGDALVAAAHTSASATVTVTAAAAAPAGSSALVTPALPVAATAAVPIDASAAMTSLSSLSSMAAMASMASVASFSRVTQPWRAQPLTAVAATAMAATAVPVVASLSHALPLPTSSVAEKKAESGGEGRNRHKPTDLMGKIVRIVKATLTGELGLVCGAKYGYYQVALRDDLQHVLGREGMNALPKKDSTRIQTENAIWKRQHDLVALSAEELEATVVPRITPPPKV